MRFAALPATKRNDVHHKIRSVVPFVKGTRVGSRTEHPTSDAGGSITVKAKPLRSDAQRSLETLLQAAKEVFAASGVDAPVREIAAQAGLGVGTVYRHFPKRSDLVAAVFRREIDACADAAVTLTQQNEPFDALAQWMQRFAAFFATKRGLAGALHSGDAAFEALPAHFDRRLRPALESLLASAAAAGQIRTDVAADELLHAVARLCSSSTDDGSGQAGRMVALLADGLRSWNIRSIG